MAQLKNTTINVSESGAEFNIRTSASDNLKIYYNSNDAASQIVTNGSFTISTTGDFNNDMLIINEPGSVRINFNYFSSQTEIDLDSLCNYSMQGWEANDRLNSLGTEYVAASSGNGKTLDYWMSDVEAALNDASNALGSATTAEEMANSAIYGIFDSSLSSSGLPLDLSSSFTRSSYSASGINAGITISNHMYSTDNTTSSGLLANGSKHYLFKNNSNSYAFIESETIQEPGSSRYTPIFSTKAFSGGYSYANGSLFSENTGFNTKTEDIGSHAEGLYTTAAGKFSHVEGAFNYTNSRYSHVEGGRNRIDPDTAIYSHTEGFLNRIAPNTSSSKFGGIIKVDISTRKY